MLYCWQTAASTKRHKCDVPRTGCCPWQDACSRFSATCAAKCRSSLLVNAEVTRITLQDMHTKHAEHGINIASNHWPPAR
jgi:hypothetical protein